MGTRSALIRCVPGNMLRCRGWAPARHVEVGMPLELTQGPGDMLYMQTSGLPVDLSKVCLNTCLLCASNQVGTGI